MINLGPFQPICSSSKLIISVSAVPIGIKSMHMATMGMTSHRRHCMQQQAVLADLSAAQRPSLITTASIDCPAEAYANV